jgi:signal transduction histidine kinase
VTLGRRTAAGLAQLGSAMSRVESGDLPAALPMAVGGEVGALTQSFNRMLSRLHRKIRDYEALSQVEEAAATPVGGDDPKPDRMLPALLRRVVGGMGADVGALILAEDNTLVTRALVGFPGVTGEGHRLGRGQGLASVVMADRTPAVVPDVGTDYRVEEPYLREGGIRAVAGVPIATGDQVVGVIEVGYRLPHVFADGEIERLSAMARRAGQAIERARTVEAVQRNTQGLEARLAQQMEALQRAASEGAEATRQAQEAERRARELEKKIQQQAEAAPAVREVVREVVKEDPAAAEQARLRLAMQKTVSEELRAPLGALLDLPRLLVDGLQKPLGDEDRRELEILQERSQEIVELIENLTLLTALAAGQVSVARAPVDLPALVARVVRALQPRAAARGNRIEVDVKPGVGRIASDARRLEQMLSGLLLTAIRYTEVGEIRVTCYLRDPNVVLAVADDGMGFTSEEQRRMFEPFLLVGARGGRALPGTGLSLAACRRLVDALGGTIKVESQVDVGTQFTVTLPAGG